MSIEVEAIEKLREGQINGKANTIRLFLNEREQDRYCKYNRHGILISQSTGLVFFKFQDEIRLVISIYEPQGTIAMETDRQPVVALYGHEEIVMVHLEDYSVVRQYTR